MGKHITRDGTEMDISEMSDSHLLNTINLIERKANGGVTIEYGSGGDDPYYDRDLLFGHEALMALHYCSYVSELVRRFEVLRVVPNKIQEGE